MVLNRINSDDPTLASLTFDWSTRHEEMGVSILLAMIDRKPSHIKKLRISNIRVLANKKRQIFEAVMNVVRINSSIEKLDLEGSALGREGCIAIANGLSSYDGGNSSSLLKRLMLNQCAITDDECTIILARSLCYNTKLEEINLSYNAIGDFGCGAIIDNALMGVSMLKKLDFSGNRIGGEGAKSLANALRSSTMALEVLYISLNKLGDEGCSEIGNALLFNSTIKEVNLNHNQIANEGAYALANALCHNTTMEELHISHNVIDYDGCLSIVSALSSNYCIKRLYMGVQRTQNFAQYWNQQRHHVEYNLRLNREAPVQAQSIKKGIFPPGLLLSNFSASCFAEAIAKVVTYGNLSALCSFIRQCPSHFDSFVLLDRPAKRQRQ